MKTTQDFFNEKFRQWGIKTRRRPTITAFAKYLDVSQATMSGWMAGNTVPNGENLLNVGQKLGYEIYDILGLPRPKVERAFYWYRDPDNPDDDVRKRVQDANLEAIRIIRESGLANEVERDQLMKKLLHDRGVYFTLADDEEITATEDDLLPSPDSDDLIYYFNELSRQDQEELIAIAKIKFERLKRHET